MLDLARIVKYDLSLTHGEALRERIDIDHAAGRLVVVERIEDLDDHYAAELAGADYFQGYFFARPSVVAARAVASNRLTLLQLLARVDDPDSTLDDTIRAALLGEVNPITNCSDSRSTSNTPISPPRSQNPTSRAPTTKPSSGPPNFNTAVGA